MKKVKSFTIIELAIGLLISSILIIILYYAYFLFSNQFRQYKNKADATGEFLLFQSTLQRDMDRADIVMDSSGIILARERSGGEVKYEMDNLHIVRYSDNGVDSFAISNAGWNGQIFNDNVTAIKSLQIRIIIGKEAINVNFKKQYCAEQLMFAESVRDEQ